MHGCHGRLDAACHLAQAEPLCQERDGTASAPF
jgi:hypothetical protein